MRDGTIPHGPPLLADARAPPAVADIAPRSQEASDASYDLVLLDVDNGPGHLVHQRTRRSTEPPFLTRAADCCGPPGLVASGPRTPRDLEATLEGGVRQVDPTGYDVSLQDRDEKYWLHVARAGAVASDG